MHEPDLPEITVKAVVLGVLLSMVLGAANAYLGLLAGMTVSASIPAAVISMAVLRGFRRASILENNIVQTAASAGESLAAGVIFTLPALLILGAWAEFDYWQTTLIAGLGGLLGTLFTIPLRRALVVEAKLAFPEGVATAAVLRVGAKAGGGLGPLVFGAGLGALFKLGETGLHLWTGSVEAATRAGRSVFCFAASLAPALVGVGYIVGFNIAVLVFLGGAANWFVAIPIAAAAQGAGPEPEPSALAWTLWKTQTRYIGVGAMIVGGLWAIVRLWPSLVRGIRSGLAAYRHARDGGSTPRTERDAPMPWVGIALVASVVPLFALFRHLAGSTAVAAFLAVVMLLAGFLFSAVASYMAGLVGSSNNPISGVTIATILTTALLLLALGVGGAAGPAAAILVGAVVCCAAAIGGDVLQDLKTGQLVGATPWKQQVMEAVGVAAAALVLAPILSLLLAAYGIGEPTATHPSPLRAPQATLMASVARGVFARDLPWGMVAIGAAAAVVVAALDTVLERRGSRFRTPVLAVAVGIYLPLELGVAIFAGGLIAWMSERTLRRRRARPAAEPHGVLLAAGLITGEALLGILLAIPIVLNAGQNPLAVGPAGGPLRWPAVVLFHVVLIALFRVATRPPRMEVPHANR
ncbi:MAG TPA: oligopeptide transporter, OPT family [Planctomycetota bacterium]|nr:oligopeptide transporter, OPT family [Planctomycetota bacterium]HRR81173.1 oligopeptide transporter, OPT family [Planctomycetota bacterium]HRT95559.1 oligopeptide transporter, OPT family [Planctomycetota bacterium]